MLIFLMYRVNNNNGKARGKGKQKMEGLRKKTGGDAMGENGKRIDGKERKGNEGRAVRRER